MRPSADQQAGLELAKRLAEENKAIGVDVDMETDGLIRSDDKFEYVKMVVPEWFCSTVCAGLNMDDVADGAADIENPTDFNTNDANLFATEEE